MNLFYSYLLFMIAVLSLAGAITYVVSLVKATKLNIKLNFFDLAVPSFIIILATVIMYLIILDKIQW